MASINFLDIDSNDSETDRQIRRAKTERKVGLSKLMPRDFGTTPDFLRAKPVSMDMSFELAKKLEAGERYTKSVSPVERGIAKLYNMYMKPSIDIGLGQIKAFHGSPFKFAKFSKKAIGTGEGAQAFGHGLYFTDSKDIGKHYRKATTCH